MNRNSILSFVIVASGTGALLASTANSQLGTPKAYVNLQPTTPGTSQSGHVNVSGTIRASQLIGGGAGVTNVNAAQLGGLASSAFGQLSGANIWTGVNAFGNPGNSFTGNGAGLTALNASNLTSGTLADARLSSNVALLNNAQTFTGAKTFSTAPSFTAAGSPFTLTGTGLVTNLNADRIDGISSESLAQLSATQTWTGANTFSNAANSFTGNGAGLMSVNADLLDGFNSTAFLQTVPNPLLISGSNSSAIIRSENSNSTFLSAAIVGASTSASGVTVGVSGSSTGPGGYGLYGRATASSGGGLGVVGESASTSGFGVYGFVTANSGTNYGVYGTTNSPTGYAGYFAGRGFFAGNVGIGTTPSVRRLEVLSSDPSSEAAHINNSSGGGLRVDALNGTAVWALSSNGFAGVDGRNASPSGSGIFGLASAASGTTFGVFGQSESTSGRGVYGEASSPTGATFGGRFQSASTSGYGAVGLASASSGSTYGVYGESHSTNGHGVFGFAFANSGTNYGGRFVSNSPQGYGGYITGIGSDALFVGNDGTGRGIRAISNSDTAVFATTTSGFAGLDARNGNPTGFGILGLAYNNTAVNYGVFGETHSPTGWGLYSFGNFGASGVKAFRIDHPSDPENKYLLHYASESPMPQNFYVGNTVTDSQGFAWVELPDYFSEINTNFKYQLTVIGKSFAQAIVYEEIVDGKFQIRTNEPNIKVSWRVDADRNDLYVRDRKPKDVVEKQGRERGTYQHPELYGMLKERGMNYRPEPEKPTQKPRK